MRKLTIATVALVATSVAALAQATPPAASQGAPAATPQAARTATPPPAATPAPQASTTGGSFGNNVAQTAVAARAAYSAKVQGKAAACTAKGALYEYVAPHSVGDANPKGGFWATNSNGSCRIVSMKKAMERGLVTVNPSAARN